MHALYERKKTLLLVALFCMNSVGSFMPAMKASSSEDRSSSQEEFVFSKLHPRIQMIAKKKEGEYSSILAYYEYRDSWKAFSVFLCINLIFSVLIICSFYQFLNLFVTHLSFLKNINNTGIPSKVKEDMVDYFVLTLVFILLFVLGLYNLNLSYRKITHPGAIFLTDTGLFFINYGYNAEYKFIPYTNIKKVQFGEGTNISVIEIKFIENFVKYMHKNVKYNGKVNTISIKRGNMSNKKFHLKEFIDLYKKLSNITQRVHIVVMREKAKQESAQEKEKSLLEIRKEEQAFIYRVEDVPEKLSEKIVAIEGKHPAIFEEIEAYYPTIQSSMFTMCIIEGVLSVITGLVYLNRSMMPKETFYLLLGYLCIALLLFGFITYNQYDNYMNPIGFFITDTGFLYLEKGSKLRYGFIRYEHIKELLCNVNEQTITINTTQSVHEDSSHINGTVPKLLKIGPSNIKEEIFNVLCQHLQLKVAIMKAGKSRLKT